jgi:hypothetical protein
MKAFIFLVKVCQLIFNNSFNFILRILMLILLGFSLSVCVLVVVLLFL